MARYRWIFTLNISTKDTDMQLLSFRETVLFWEYKDPEKHNKYNHYVNQNVVGIYK